MKYKKKQKKEGTKHGSKVVKMMLDGLALEKVA